MNRAGPPDAARWFAERYGREPEGVWFAPGRVNLMGGPDYTEVFVLPFALPIGVYAAASRRSDRRIALTSQQAAGEPVVLDIDALEPGSVGGCRSRGRLPRRATGRASCPSRRTTAGGPRGSRRPAGRPRAGAGWSRVSHRPSLTQAMRPRASPSMPQFPRPAIASTTSNPCGRPSSRSPSRHGPPASCTSIRT